MGFNLTLTKLKKVNKADFFFKAHNLMVWSAVQAMCEPQHCDKNMKYGECLCV